MNFSQIINNITTAIYPVRTIRKGIGSGIKINTKNSSGDYTKGTNEYPVQQMLALHLKQGDVFYDIGANIGFFSLIAARLVGPSGHVFAFEPVPDNVLVLRENAVLNDFENITVFQKAASSKTDRGELIITRHPGGAKLVTVDSPLNSKMKGKILVDLVRIDELVEHQKINPPSLIKIDVEGAELDVFEGMNHTIEKFKPVIVYELDHKYRQNFIRRTKTVDNFIKNLGYEIEILEESYSGISWNVRHALALPK